VFLHKQIVNRTAFIVSYSNHRDHNNTIYSQKQKLFTSAEEKRHKGGNSITKGATFLAHPLHSVIIIRSTYLVPFAFTGDLVRACKQAAVMSCELVPAAVVIVRHHQQIVHVPADNQEVSEEVTYIAR